MSLKHIQLEPILPTNKQDWTDLNRDGKKLNKVLNMCYTTITPRKGREKLDHNLTLSYIAAICRLTHEKASLVETVLGIRKAIDDAKK